MFLTPAGRQHFVAAALCAVSAPLWIERRDEHHPQEGCTDQGFRLTWSCKAKRLKTKKSNRMINNTLLKIKELKRPICNDLYTAWSKLTIIIIIITFHRAGIVLL